MTAKPQSFVRSNQSLDMADATKTLCFREAVCRKFGCASDSYAEVVFWHCLYPHAVWPAKLIRRLYRYYFDLDFELLDLIAGCTEPHELRALVDSHRYHHPTQSLLRGLLRIRLSGQRVINLGGHLLAHQPLGASAFPKEQQGS